MSNKLLGGAAGPGTVLRTARKSDQHTLLIPTMQAPSVIQPGSPPVLLARGGLWPPAPTKLLEAVSVCGIVL